MIEADAVDRRTLAVATVAFFVVSFFAFAFFFLRMAILWDADSYYHLAVARLYAGSGIGAHIPWARFSLLANGGDKDLLFHIFLMPFASLVDPAIGGRLALALLNAAIATAIGSLAARAIGLWGFALAPWLWIAAPPFFTRIVRLRPELIALLIILIAIPFAARRKWIVLGVLAALFTWSYTAFHVFLAICVIWWLLDRYRQPLHERLGLPVTPLPAGEGGAPDERSEEEAPGEGRATALNLLPPFVGAAIALIARPDPIANAKLWFVQNITFFANVGRLDVGDEIRPPSITKVGLASIAWLIALVVLALLARRRRAAIHPLALYAAVPAIVFTLLFFAMVRMATYFYPLATLAIILAFAPSLRTQDSRLRTVVGTLAVTALLAIPFALNPTFVQIISGAPVVSEADWEAFGKAVPNGARIAASWGDAEIYALWAPQGRYLNVLDPVFMASSFPREYDVQRAIFAGVHPDIPFSAKSVLESDFIAVDWSDAPRDLVERIKSDPRFRVVYGGYNVLAEIVPSDAFVVDWMFVDGSFIRRYPLVPPPLRGLEGFVSARRVTQAHCATFTREAIGPSQFGFAPYGQGALAVDDRVVATSNGLGGNLARAIPIAIPAGSHRIQVRTCEAFGFNGFYFVRR